MLTVRRWRAISNNATPQGERILDGMHAAAASHVAELARASMSELRSFTDDIAGTIPILPATNLASSEGELGDRSVVRFA